MEPFPKQQQKFRKEQMTQKNTDMEKESYPNSTTKEWGRDDHQEADMDKRSDVVEEPSGIDDKNHHPEVAYGGGGDGDGDDDDNGPMTQQQRQQEREHRGP